MAQIEGRMNNFGGMDALVNYEAPETASNPLLFWSKGENGGIMSEYYCSHKPPCCPQVEALKAEVERLKDERNDMRDERDSWMTLANRYREALEKISTYVTENLHNSTSEALRAKSALEGEGK